MGSHFPLPPWWRAAALVLLALLSCSSVRGQSAPKKSYTFETGEKVKFIGDTASFKYWPKASANCTDCFLNFRLGALSELDAFGQPIATHTIPDLSLLEAEVTGGPRVSGVVSYHYLTLTFDAGRLPASLTKSHCPTLESIMSNAYAAGVRPQDSNMMSMFESQASMAAQGGPGGIMPPRLGGLGPHAGRHLAQTTSSTPTTPQLRTMLRKAAEAVSHVLESESLAPTAPSAAASRKRTLAPTSEPATGSTPVKPPAQAPAAAATEGVDAPAPAAAAIVGTPVPILTEPVPGDAATQQPGAMLQVPAAPAKLQPPQLLDDPAGTPAAGLLPAPSAGLLPVPEAPPKKAEPAAEKPAEPSATKGPPDGAAPQPAGKAAAASPPSTATAPKPAADAAPTSASTPQEPAAAAKGDASVPAKAGDAAGPPRQAMMVEGPPQAELPQQRDATAEAEEEEMAEEEEQQAAGPAPAAAVPPPHVHDPTGLGQVHQQLQANGGYLTPPAALSVVEDLSRGGQGPLMQGPGAMGGFGGMGGMGGFGAAQYPYSFGPETPPVIKVTFMFGFSANKTFAYGRGRVVSAPAGSVKFNIDAQNWPFCSLYNTLKLEVVMTSIKDPQAQIIYTDDSLSDEVRVPTSHVSRRLHQEDGFTEFMGPDVKKAAVGLGGQLPFGAAPGLGPSSYVPTKHVETAKMLVGPKLAAAIEFPTYSFASERFNGEANATVALATNTREAARFSVGFGYCEQGLFYDPVVYFAHTNDMLLAGGDGGGGAASYAMPNGTTACRRGDADCLMARRRDRAGGARNGAAARGASLATAAASLACALVLMAALVV